MHHHELEHDVERRSGRAPAAADMCRAVVAGSQIPGALLGLQRLAGNRALSAALTTPAVSLQRFDTYTGLKAEHAQKVLKNHLKGDPPFKPIKGNFGRISWFAGTGRPYVGGQAQKYDVVVHVTIDDPKKMSSGDVRDFIENYGRANGVNLRNPATHHDFWVALGTWLEGRGAVEVPIDVSKVNWEEAGTFVVVDTSARERVRLRDPARLEADLAPAGPTTRADVAAKAGGAASSFCVTLRLPVASTATPAGALAAAQSRLQAHLRTTPTTARATNRTINPPPTTAAERLTGATADVTVELVFADYARARTQAKLISTAMGDGKLDSARAIIAGTGWPPKATKSYRT
ncbi:hypothetical protein [Cellulosimicrobium sp. Marseille-Q8652]